MGESNDYDHLFKLLLVGDAAVGKSSLLLRFTDGSFDLNLQSTIGVDFKVKMMKIANKTCKVTIWDTAGQERFRTLTSSYYRGAHGIILVYDVTRPETFQHLQQWLNEIEMYSPGGGKSIVKLLVGNKTDMVNDRAVSTKDGENLAKQKGMLFLESSAKSQDNVKAVFEEVVQKILETPSLLVGTGVAAIRPGLAKLNAAPAPPVREAGQGKCC
jgi:Ras-related protein Rab-18